MALAVHRTGTILCDRSNHKPDSNKRCASATRQHTCGNPGRCAHASTLRYWDQQADWEIIPRLAEDQRGLVRSWPHDRHGRAGGRA